MDGCVGGRPSWGHKVFQLVVATAGGCCHSYEELNIKGQLCQLFVRKQLDMNAASAEICYRPRPPAMKMSYPPLLEIDGEAIRERAKEPAGRAPAEQLTYQNSKANSKTTLRTCRLPNPSLLGEPSRLEQPSLPTPTPTPRHHFLRLP